MKKKRKAKRLPPSFAGPGDDKLHKPEANRPCDIMRLECDYSPRKHIEDENPWASKALRDWEDAEAD